jgi:hypothetical protein
MALRERSRIAVGCSARPRRIFKLDCRYEGSDCEIARSVYAVTDFS